MAYTLDIPNRFKRAYKKLPPDVQNIVDDALEILVKGKPYPKSLRVQKMKGHRFVFEASPTMQYRITFHFKNPDYIVLRNVGDHNITLKNP
ncbi:cytotoxin [Sporolactobacillus terrae]|uniref:cytotoxin n=1 Tax=Sporolactobacillus terrae TaxID=269673 RepID=UPI001CBA8A19|nr:cytotoxin [Sporolactobacillus terrae]UAK18092.1 cytotoxin [Sporolactobacillus terrae]